MFQNPEIALHSLPDMEDLHWQQIHPRYARRLQLERALFVCGIAIATLAAKFLVGIPSDKVFMLWLGLLIVAVPLLVWPVISVPRRGYVIRDKDIVFKSGVIWRSVTAIPFNRVQHVETSNTPLDRKFGLANLQIFTAGGSGGDLRISGLGLDTAEQLRVYILGKVGASIETHQA
ncbi:MAG: PH domain-containing protein [Gammaproteobacteria bacterium]|nr:PH domain-containing protein [Gammaproteobacteria bacterium]MDH3431362.1 PH domain-containing protein [Gammaproteobacteria bacterium]